MIQPIITANQAIANRTLMTSPYFAGKMNDVEVDLTAPSKVKAPVTNPVKGDEECECSAPTTTTDSSVKGEKLDINFGGCKATSHLGNNINYFA